MVVFILIFLVILTLLLYVIGKSALSFILHFFLVNVKEFWIVYLVVQIAFICLLFIPNRIFHIINGYWMAFIFYFFMFSIVGAFIKIFPIGNMSMKIVDITKVALTFIVVIAGLFIAKNIQVTTYEVKIKKTVPDMNIVVFSDLHLGYQIGYNRVADTVKMVNDLSPDIVLIPGDIFDGNIDIVEDLEMISKEFKMIKAKYGVYASLGNHDVTKDEEKIKRFLEQSNITLLQDDSLVVNGITLIGRRDKRPIDSFKYERITMEDLLVDVDSTMPIIVMDHQPADINSAIDNDVDLIISGHTHNGQVFPGSIVTNLLFKVGYGYKTFNNTSAVVTSGVGYWGPPIRIGSKSEIVNIKLSSR